MERPKLNTLTSLRFFAAGLVFLYHYARGIPGAPTWFLSLSSHPFAAVTFFFVLSGFILAYSYLDEDKPGRLKGTRKAFWISRVSRIYPLYALALLLALPAYAYATARGRNSLGDSALGLALVPSMVQAWIPSMAIEWNPPAWSLSVEAVFYILFPFLISREVRGKGWGLLVLSFVLVCCASVSCQWLWHLKLDGSAAINYNWRNFLLYFPLFHLPSFLVGLALGRIFLQPSGGRLGLQTLAFWGSLTVLAGVLLGRSVLPAFFYSQPALIRPFLGRYLFRSENRRRAAGPYPVQLAINPFG